MIQVKKGTVPGAVALGNREGEVIFNEKTISIGSEEFSQPGEYESASVALIYGQTAAVIEWERLQIIDVISWEKPSAFDAAQFNSADVVVLHPIGGEALTKSAYGEIVSAYEPSVVIFHSDTTMAIDLKESLKPEETSVIKLSAATLPTEGRQVFLLS